MQINLILSECLSVLKISAYCSSGYTIHGRPQEFFQGGANVGGGRTRVPKAPERERRRREAPRD
jgi:hypothetical protein